METLSIEYKDNLTLFRSSNTGLLTRLSIVLGEEGYDLDIRKVSGELVVTTPSLVSMDQIKSVINEYFNPDVIDIRINQ